jgi:hypothetical protein
VISLFFFFFFSSCPSIITSNWYWRVLLLLFHFWCYCCYYLFCLFSVILHLFLSWQCWTFSLCNICSFFFPTGPDLFYFPCHSFFGGNIVWLLFGFFFWL